MKWLEHHCTMSGKIFSILWCTEKTNSLITINTRGLKSLMPCILHTCTVSSTTAQIVGKFPNFACLENCHQQSTTWAVNYFSSRNILEPKFQIRKRIFLFMFLDFFPGSTLKYFSLTFCHKNLFWHPHMYSDSQKNLGQKLNVKFFMMAPYVEVT